MTFNIYEYKNRGLFEGGARPNKFEVALTFPLILSNPLAGIDSTFLIQAATLPPTIMGKIDVPYMGRTIKVNGDREYPGWEVTIQNREDFGLRDAFEEWAENINSTIGNLMNPAFVNINNGYKVDFAATQFTKDGAIAKVYQFVGAFPTNVGPIQLAWDAQNQIETFPVTFEYDLWTSNTTNADGPIQL